MKSSGFPTKPLTLMIKSPAEGDVEGELVDGFLEGIELVGFAVGNFDGNELGASVMGLNDGDFEGLFEGALHTAGPVT